MELLVLVAVTGCVGFLLGRAARERAVGKELQELDARRGPPPRAVIVPPGVRARLEQHSLEADYPQLLQYVRTVFKHFGSDIARQAPIRYPPAPDEDRLAYLKLLVRLSARRYAIPLHRVFVRFTPIRKGREAGSIHERGDAFYLDVVEQYKDNDTALAAIVAHEMAHYALLKSGIRLDDTQANEELTDTLVILAGFGPLVLSVYHEEFSGQVGDSYQVYVGTMGYLHPSAVALLTLLQTEVAGLTPHEILDWTSPWYGRAWELFSRRVDASRQGHLQTCYACGESLPKPDPGAQMRTCCSVCKTVQRFGMESTPDFRHTA